jgi:protein-arginine kinase activator protein McsA
MVTCLLFIIQDIQEGDTLCGRYGPHTSNIQRHCRNCDVTYAQLDDQRVRCSVLVAKEMHVIAQSDDKVKNGLSTHWIMHLIILPLPIPKVA